MYKFIIADDEAIVRSLLSTIINWEEHGFSLVGSVATGKAALSLAKSENVDLILTDIKMPIMDGLELIEELKKMEKPPIVVVLSAYSDFELVRRAFKLGALDYIVKSDMTPELISEMALNLKKIMKSDPSLNKHDKLALLPSEALKEFALGVNKADFSYVNDKYILASVEIDNFRKESVRFGKDLDKQLIQPLLSFASQVPRISSKCVITDISSSHFLLLYTNGSETKCSETNSICAQLQKTWKAYMNISVTIGVSEVGEGSESFSTLLKNAYDYATCKYIFGHGGIYGVEAADLFLKNNNKASLRFDELCSAMKSSNKAMLMQQQQILFERLHASDIKNAREIALLVIYQTAMTMADVGTELWDIFNTEVETDFYQRISRFETVREIEMWLNNFTNWVEDYAHDTQVGMHVDVMEKAKRFISENYADPNLNLSAVASYVALNEKYFSTRFNKETSTSFTGYLTQIRISMAKQMILKTDMKIYEICDAVGFSNVEHFTRVFKKQMGASPLSLRKQK